MAYWNIGVLECWFVAARSLHYSNIPVLQGVELKENLSYL
jgi:hypothetical protein